MNPFDEKTAITKKARAEADEQANQYAAAMRRESKLDGAWTHSLLRTWLNGRRLVDVQANREMLESLLNPNEEPSAEIYETLAKQFPQKFTWETPRPAQTDAQREAEFAKICREHWLSECDANRELHKQGISTEAWVGCSRIERTRFEEEAAQARQHRLIHSATPTELKAEAAYEWQTNHVAAQRAELDRRHQYVLRLQEHYPGLPTTTSDGNTLDAAYLRKISTTDFQLFKRIVKKFGSGNVTARLRGE